MSQLCSDADADEAIMHRLLSCPQGLRLSEVVWQTTHDIILALSVATSLLCGHLFGRLFSLV
jgi:hypothetical protein